MNGAAGLPKGGEGIVDATAIKYGPGTIRYNRFRRDGCTGGFYEFVHPVDNARVVAVGVFRGMFTCLFVGQGGVDVYQLAGDALRLIIGADPGDFPGVGI